MRVLGLVVMLTTVTCTTAVPGPAAPPRPSTTTSATAPPTTVTETPATVTLELDEVEALAADDGIHLEVTGDSGETLGRLDRSRPELVVDTTMRTLTLRYIAADGEPTRVTWEQRLERPVTTIRQPWRGRGECAAALPDGSTTPVVLVWQAGGDTATYLDQLDGAAGQVTVVSPIWWRIAADGATVSSADPGYVEAVHDRNVAIWPAVAGFDADTHHLVFSDAARRTALAREISDEAQRVGADGVNIDIEGYRHEDAGVFLAWVEELAAMVRKWGGVVSYDLVPRSDHWDVRPDDLAFWSTAPLRSELSRAVDCTVLMAYDQHNRYRPAGPVASPRWVEEVLVHALRHTDPDGLVLGIPFYARVWDPADLERPQAIGIGDLEGLAADGVVTHDPNHGLDRVDLADGRFFWAETPAGLEQRLDLVAGYGLAGWAAWRFGFDDPTIWELVGAGGG